MLYLQLLIFLLNNNTLFLYNILSFVKAILPVAPADLLVRFTSTHSWQLVPGLTVRHIHIHSNTSNPRQSPSSHVLHLILCLTGHFQATMMWVSALKIVSYFTYIRYENMLVLRKN